MTHLPSIQPLTDVELDLVHGGMPKHGQTPSLTETGRVSIGSIVVVASGDAQVTINIIGAESTISTGAAHGHHQH